MKIVLKRLSLPLVTLGLFFLLAGLTPVFWFPFDHWFLEQRKQAWSQVERQVGFKIDYDRISPSLLSLLEFRNVRLLAPDGRVLLSAGALRLSWDWFALLRGDPLQVISTVQLINASLQIDLAKDQAFIHKLQSLVPVESTQRPWQGQLELFNASLHVVDGSQTFHWERVFANLSQARAQWEGSFRGSFAWANQRDESFAHANIRGNLSGSLSWDQLSAKVSAEQISTSWFDLDPVTVQVGIKGAAWNVVKVADHIPLDLEAFGNSETGLWSVRGSMERFQPSTWVSPRHNEVLADVFRGRLTGSFEWNNRGEYQASGRADFPQGALPGGFSSLPMIANGTLSGDPQEVIMEPLEIETPQLKARFQGNFQWKSGLPDGRFELERWNFGDGGLVSGTANFVRSQGAASFEGEDWRWNSIVAPQFTGLISRQSGSWSFSTHGALAENQGTIQAQGLWKPSSKQFEVQLALQNIEFSILKPEIERMGVSSGALSPFAASQVNVSLGLRFNAHSFSVEVPRFVMADPTKKDRQIEASGTWKDSQLTVVVGRLNWDRFRALFQVKADIKDQGVIDARLDGSLWDRPLQATAHWTPQNQTLVFEGKPGFHGRIRGSPLGQWFGELIVEPSDLFLNWRVGFQAFASWGKAPWSLEVKQLWFSAHYPWNGDNFIFQGRLRLTPRDLFISEGSLADKWGTSVLTLESSWSLDSAAPWNGTLSTKDQGGGSATVKWSGQVGSSWKVTADTSSWAIDRFLPASVSGLHARMTSVSTWGGTLQQFEWTTALSITEGRWNDTPLALQVDAHGTPDLVQASRFNLSLSPVRITSHNFSLDLRHRTGSLDSDVSLRLAGNEWNSHWQASASWDANDKTTIGMGLHVSENKWGKSSFPVWDARFVWAPDKWSFLWGKGELALHGSPDGAFSADAVKPFPVQGHAEGSAQGKDWSATIQNFSTDLSWFAPLLSSPAFSVKEGQVHGDLRLSGTFVDPEIEGSLTVKGLVALSSFVRQPLGPVDLPLEFHGHLLKLLPVNVGPRGQKWIATGAATLDHYGIASYQFAVQTDSLSTIPAQYEYTGLSAQTDVTGLFQLSGTPQEMTIGGRLVLQDASITLKDTKPDEGGEPLGFNADLTLVTGRKVEFLWPNVNLPLLRAVSATGQSVVIKVDDQASSWSVTGKVALVTGELNYLNRTFQIREGQLNFQENEDKFDPRLRLRAEWKVPDVDGTTTISLRADGTLKNFSPRFDAVPYKTPEELQQLVGTSLALPSDYTNGSNLDAALSVASDVGTSFLLSPFEEAVRKNFHLDLFTVRTDILKMTLLNRNAPQDAIDYLDNTRLFFGKYVSDDLFLQGTLAFQRDQTVVSQLSSKLVAAPEFQPEFQMELQTPFFLFNWTLLPQHPETLFVTDNTVTFQWDWSY